MSKSKIGLVGDSAKDNTTIPVVDGFLVAAMYNPDDRQFLLNLEANLDTFLADPEAKSLQLNDLNAYLRLVVHRAAQYYNLKHVLHQTESHFTRRRSVCLYKTSLSRWPGLRFEDLIPRTQQEAPPPLNMPMMVPPPLSMPGIAPPTPLTMAVPSEPHWCPPAMSLMYPIHPPFLPPSVWMFDPARNCFILMHLTAVAPIPKSPEFGGLLTAGPIGCETICPPPTHSDMMFYPSLPATPFVGEYPAAHRGLIQADPYAHGDEAISRSNKQGTCVRLDSPGGSYSGVQQELTDVPPSLAHIVAVTAWPMPRPEIMAAIFPGAVAREFYSPASKGAIVSRLLVFATVDVAMSACAAYPEIVSPWHVHVAPKRDGLAPLRSKQANRMQ